MGSSRKFGMAMAQCINCGKGGKCGDGGQRGEGGGDVLLNAWSSSTTPGRKRETPGRLATAADAVARGGVITIRINQEESAELKHMLRAGREYNEMRRAKCANRKDQNENDVRNCGVNDDESDQDKFKLVEPRLQCLAAFLCQASHSPMTSSSSSRRVTIQRYYKDLIATATDAAMMEKFLMDIQMFMIVQRRDRRGVNRNTRKWVKFFCDIKDDDLRKAVVETLMVCNSASVIPSPYSTAATLNYIRRQRGNSRANSTALAGDSLSQ